MLTNMFYEVPEEVLEPVSKKPRFLVDQLDLIGGIQFIFIEVWISFDSSYTSQWLLLLTYCLFVNVSILLLSL